MSSESIGRNQPLSNVNSTLHSNTPR